jgi:hypothetical protein
MAQKFITKKNKHLFRKPVKVAIKEKVIIELPLVKDTSIDVDLNKVISNTVIEPEIINTNIITPEVEATNNELSSSEKITEEPKKRKSKKSKEITVNIDENKE